MRKLLVVVILLIALMPLNASAQSVSQVSCEPCFTVSRQQFVSYDIQTKTLTLTNPGVNCIIRDQIQIFGLSSGQLSVPLGSIICGNQTYNISGVEPNTQLTISYLDQNHLYVQTTDSATISVKYYVDVLFPNATVYIKPNKSATVNFTVQNNQNKDDVFSIEASQISGVSIELQNTRLQVKANSSATTTMTVTDSNATNQFALILIARSGTDGNVYGTGKLEFTPIQVPIPTTTSISPQGIQNQTNVSSNETNVPLAATLSSVVQPLVFLLILILPVIFYIGIPRLAKKFNADLSGRQRKFGTVLIFLAALFSYLYFFYPLIFIVLMIYVTFGLAVWAYLGVVRKCPKCGKLFGRKLLSIDIIDQKIFAHGTVTIYNNHYICKSCGYKWSTRSEENKVRWGSDRERRRRWAKWLDKPVGKAPPSSGYKPKDFFK